MKFHASKYFLSRCFSTIGRLGGKQDLSIGGGCAYKGTVLHEVMHALGKVSERKDVLFDWLHQCLRKHSDIKGISLIFGLTKNYEIKSFSKAKYALFFEYLKAKYSDLGKKSLLKK